MGETRLSGSSFYPIRFFLLGLALAACVTSCATPPASSGHEPIFLDTVEEVQPGAWRCRLTWNTETESGAFGFYIYRSDSQSGERVCINEGNPLHAAGTTTTPQVYVYYDLTAIEGRTYYYSLEQVDLDGTKNWLIRNAEAKPKALTDDELQDIRTHGSMYREEGA